MGEKLRELAERAAIDPHAWVSRLELEELEQGLLAELDAAGVPPLRAPDEVRNGLGIFYESAERRR